MRGEMDEGARLWMLKTIREEFWRIAGWCDFEDVVQDGALCYWIVCRRYPRITHPPHLMALFKRTFRNHLIDLSRLRTKALALRTAVDTEPPDDDLCLDAEMARLIAEAPPPLDHCLATIATRPDVLAQPLRSRRESINDWLCRICGIEPHDRMRLALRSYLAHE